MLAVKSLDNITSKWSDRASGAGNEYSQGIDNPRRSWEQATKAGETSYEQGIQAAIGRKAFGKGVTRAGDAKWKQRAKELGSARYASGVTASQEAYNRGFAPYHQVLSGLTLSPRGAKGSPANLNRVAQVATALRNAKIAK